MCSSASILLLLFIKCNHILSLFLSENRLTWIEANNYCINRCSSTLVSFHNDSYIQTINYTIPNSINISSAFSDYWGNSGYWIGLYKSYLTSLQWYDETPFDFGNQYYSYPWNPGEPNNNWNEDCVHLWDTMRYRWNNVYCNLNMRFICNNCKGKLEKYLLIQQTATWSYAQTFCSTNIGTSLASIHSQEDQDEIIALCSPHSQHCWIGLSDVNSEGNYMWSDGTSLDYGRNSAGGITPGEYPWGDSPDYEPNGGTGENCIHTHSDKQFRWNDESCFSSNSYFVCNMPSEICFKDNWQIIQNSGSVSWNNCEMNSTSDLIAIINKQWVYSNDLWVIEYIYTVNKLVDVYGKAGLTIHHFDRICDYYYVGIAINEADAHLFIYSYVSNIETEIFYSNPLFVYEFETYYVLKIELLYTTKLVWNVYVNDIKYAVGVTSDNITYLNDHKYIGVQHMNAAVIAKSLFLSETLQYVSSGLDVFNLWTRCTSPTAMPSTTTTQLPTLNNISITYGVSITISFQYDLNNVSMNISEINNILMDITQNIIEEEIDNVHICTDSNNYNISIIQTEVTTIKATVLVCNENDQNILIAQFNYNQHLQTEFINEFDKDKHLLIDKTSIILDVDIVYKNDIETTMTVPNIDRNSMKDDEKDFILVLVLVFVLLVLFFICLVSAYKMYLLNKRKNGHGKPNIEMISNVPSNSPMMSPTGAHTKTISDIFNLMNDGKSTEIISSDSKIMDNDVTAINKKNMIIGEELELKKELVVTSTTSEDNNKQSENDTDDKDETDDKLDWTPGLQYVTISNEEMNRYGIKQWLHKIDLSQYFDNFVENGYESMNFIKEITMVTQLDDIGIVNVGHKQEIISNLKTLRGNNPQQREIFKNVIRDADIATKGNDNIETKGNNKITMNGNDDIDTKGNDNTKTKENDNVETKGNDNIEIKEYNRNLKDEKETQ